LGLALLALVSFTSAGEETPVVRFTVTGFTVSGDNPLSEEQTQAILAPLAGEHEGLAGLTAAAAELESAILSAGHSFHRVILPPQTIEGGYVSLKVVTFKLADVQVTGNQYFSPENIRASLPALKAGSVPNTSELSRELIVANDHPSKKVTIRIKRSKVPDSVDAELDVEDRRPWQFFAALNNIGTDETGDFRISAGFQHSNLLNRDDALTLSYTTSPDHFDDVQQYGFNYQFPLYPLSGSLSFFYSQSDVDSGRIEQVFDVSGAGTFLGGYYTHTFLNSGGYRHRLRIGVEDRLFDDNIDFQGTPIGVDVRSRPLALSYSGEWRQERDAVNFQVAYVLNLGGGGDNSDAAYAAARFGAEQDWHAVRLAIFGSHLFSNNWSVHAAMIGQYAGDPLINGEQLGLGGANSIRGFEERAVSGDRGYRLSLEAWTPPLKYDVRLLGFIEGGQVESIDAPPGEIDSETLVSLGLGLRWRWADKLNLSFDFGQEINDARISGAGGTKAHFSLFYRF
jgi:hemolysin activation/secretion protein